APLFPYTTLFRSKNVQASTNGRIIILSSRRRIEDKGLQIMGHMDHLRDTWKLLLQPNRKSFHHGDRKGRTSPQSPSYGRFRLGCKFKARWRFKEMNNGSEQLGLGIGVLKGLIKIFITLDKIQIL